MSLNDITSFDRDHLWHPYTSLGNTDELPVVVGAQGCTIELADGRKLVDGMASWWAAIQGYNHPELNQAIQEQLQDFAHVMFGGLTHWPAVELGKRILELTSPSLNAIFYSDSGSVAVEVALKMALQYWQGMGRPEKTKIMTLRSGYHGDTFATMAMSDPSDGMHGRFSGLLYEPIYLDKPLTGYSTEVPQAYFDHLDHVFEQSASGAAALVMEPIVQNAGGMNIYNPTILSYLRKLCDQHDVLLVLDEIATGFGRTGKLFGYEHAHSRSHSHSKDEKIAPDILCIGKAMTAGYLSFAATVTSHKIAEGVAGPNNEPLMHGPTYMGNALAAAVAAKNLEIISRGDWQQQVANIESQLDEKLQPCRNLPGVKGVRVLGAIGVVEVDRPVDLARATSFATERGVWLRPFRNLLYCMPPYVISDSELENIVDVIYKAIAAGEY